MRPPSNLSSPGPIPLSPPETTSTWLGWQDEFLLESNLYHGINNTYPYVTLLKQFVNV